MAAHTNSFLYSNIINVLFDFININTKKKISFPSFLPIFDHRCLFGKKGIVLIYTIVDYQDWIGSYQT